VRKGCGILIGVLAALAATVAVAAAQTANPIPGYFDLKTRVFTPAPQQQPASPPAQAVNPSEPPPSPIPRPSGGTVIINVNATIVSPIPQGATLNAFVKVTIADAVGAGDSAGSTPYPYPFALARSDSTATGSARVTYAVPAPSSTLPQYISLAPLKMKVSLELSVMSASGPRPFIVLTQSIDVPQSGGNLTVTFPVTI